MPKHSKHGTRIAFRIQLGAWVGSWVALYALPCSAYPNPAVTAPPSPSDDATAHLDVVFGPGTDACPGVDFVRGQFVEALGVTNPTNGVVRITVDHEREGYVARIRVKDRVRELRSPDCRELATSAAWIAAISSVERAEDGNLQTEEEPNLTPASSSSPAPTSSPPSSAPRAPTTEESRPARLDSPPRSDRDRASSASIADPWRRKVQLTASMLFGDNYVPGVSPGVAWGAAYRGAFWSLGGEARLYPRKRSDVTWSKGQGAAFVTAALAASVACLRWNPVHAFGLEGCSTFALGADVVSVQGLPRITPVQPAVYVGGRAGVEVRPIPALAFDVSVTLEGAPISGNVAFLDGAEPISIWHDVPVAGAGAFETRALF